MNRLGVNAMMSNMFDVIIFILFFFLAFMFVNSYSNGSALWEDFYSKEIANVINTAEPGMEFKIDISKLAAIASKNGKPVKDIISIDNVNNKITASSRIGTGTSFGFFNDFDIVEWKTESPSGSATTTQFIFTVKEKQRNDLS